MNDRRRWGVPGIAAAGLVLLAVLVVGRAQGPVASHGSSSPAVSRGDRSTAIVPISVEERGQASVPSPSTGREGAVLLDQVRSRYRTAASALRKLSESSPYGGFADLERKGLLELRCWARGFPREALAAALAACRDGSADPDDRQMALEMLAALSEAGDDEAADELVGIARIAGHPLGARALDLVAAGPFRDRDQDVLVRAAFEGHRGAIDALGRTGTVESVSRLRTLAEVLERSPDPDVAYGMNDAVVALERAERLSQPDWQEALVNVISDPKGDQGPLLRWALQVAGRTRLPGLASLLQERLAREEQRERSWLIDANPGKSDAEIAARFSSSIDLPERRHGYDQILLLYLTLGGELNTLQRSRLEHFGLTGDPAETLRRLLSRPSRWW